MPEKFSNFLNLNQILRDKAEPKIIWNAEFVGYVQDQINWKYLSSSDKINANIVKAFPNKIDWKLLSRNSNFKWNTDLIRKFQDKIDWYYFSSHFQLESLYDIHVCFLLEEFIDKFEWTQLCRNKHILFNQIFHYHNAEHLKNYKHKFDWNELSRNLNFPWNSYLLEENKDKLDWNEIILNPSIYKSKEFLLKYHDKFVWSGYYRKFQHTHTYYPANISTIPDIDIPIEILKIHHKDWKKSLSFDPWAEKEFGESEWSNYSSKNCFISVDIMKTFDAELGFYGIFNNRNFQWTKEKVDYCKNKRGFSQVLSHNEHCKSLILAELLNESMSKKKNKG